MLQKLPYRDIDYPAASPGDISNTLDISDHGYYIVCDIN